jgi:hypothetical protein
VLNLSTKPWIRMEEWRCSSTIFISALYGGETPASCPGRFNPRERSSVPISYEAGAGLNVVKKRKIFPLSEIEPVPSSPSLYQLGWTDFREHNDSVSTLCLVSFVEARCDIHEGLHVCMVCTYLPTYGSTALLDLGRFFSFLIYTQSVGLPGQGSARRKAATYTGQHRHRINAHRHPCLEWDSKPRSQRSSKRRQFMPQTARPLWSASGVFWKDTNRIVFSLALFVFIFFRISKSVSLLQPSIFYTTSELYECLVAASLMFNIYGPINSPAYGSRV